MASSYPLFFYRELLILCFYVLTVLNRVEELVPAQPEQEGSP